MKTLSRLLTVGAISLSVIAGGAISANAAPMQNTPAAVVKSQEDRGRESVTVVGVTLKYFYVRLAQRELRNMSSTDFTRYVYKQVGIDIPSNPTEQQKVLQKSLLPYVGGLVFQKGTTRAGIYIGNGLVVEWRGAYRIVKLWSNPIYTKQIKIRG